jgi:hypothetical protein
MLQACHREAALAPTALESVTSKFDFPQGASPTDEVIKEIYERYGVKLIYTAFTQIDVDRAWKSPEGDSFFSEQCEWSYLKDDTQLETAVGILKEKVFGLLPVDVVKAGLRACPYFYVVDNIHYAEGSRLRMPIYPAKGLDSWMVDVASGYHRKLDNYSMRVFYPARIMCEIFVYAFVGGAITAPPGFFDGVDTRTATLKSYKAASEAGPGTDAYKNYWARRGFPPFVSTIDGRISTGRDVKASCSLTASVMSPLTEATREIAQFFLFLCLDTNWRSYFAQNNIFDDCEKLEERLRMFNDHMRDVYGINFDTIREKLYEGSNLDMSPARYARPTADTQDPSFIYANY